MLFLIFTVSSVFAAKAGIYGLNGQNQLAHIDPQTAKITTFGSAPSGYLQSQQLCDVDQKNGILYSMMVQATTSKTALLGFDLNTGTVVKNVSLPFFSAHFVGVGDNLNVIQSTGEVLCSGLDSTLAKHELYRVNPTSGSMTKINEIALGNVLGSVSVFAEKSSRWWIQYMPSNGAYVNNYGFDVTKPNSKPVVVPSTHYLEAASYDFSKHLVYGIGLKKMMRTALVMDGSNGTVHVDFNLPTYSVIQSRMGTLDYKSSVFYTILSTVHNPDTFYLVGVDFKTKKVVSDPELFKQSQPLPVWDIAYYS